MDKNSSAQLWQYDPYCPVDWRWRDTGRLVDTGRTTWAAGQTTVMLKRLESAQRRHLNALKQLVQIRKLLPNRGAIPELRVYPGERESA